MTAGPTSPRRRRVCFVSFEIHPFTAGGIGVWLANTLEAYCDGPADFEVLFCGPHPPPADLFERIYPGVRLHLLDMDKPDPGLLEGSAVGQHRFHSYAHWRSWLIMRALERLERETGPYDLVEFVDWCGAAFFSLNAKRLGRSFQRTVLAVRLHATESLLRDYETRPWSDDNLAIADLERLALLEADEVVGHLPSTADACQEHFGFDEAWRRRCHIEMPPVAVGRRATAPIRPGPDTPILFTSKIQSIKRPQIFARGVTDFMASRPGWRGEARFLAFDVDGALRRSCEAAIPAALRDRVRFGGPRERGAREAVIGEAVVVFPNAFEAFCFAAYEASLNGAVVVLNGANHAFGDGTPWRDGINCLKFDGTARGLQRTLERLFDDPTSAAHLVPVEAAHEPSPYWERVAPAPPFDAPLPEIAAAVVHRYEGRLLHETLNSLFAAPDAPSHVVVASDAGDEPSAGLVLDAVATLAAQGEERVTLVRHGGMRNPGQLMADAIAATDAEAVAVVPAGYRLEAGFLALAREALARNPGHDVVLPTIRCVAEHDPLQVDGEWLPLGAAVRYGLWSNKMSPGPFVARRAFLEAFPPDETLQAEWTWDVLLRGIFAGRRYLVADVFGFETIGRVLHDYEGHGEAARREAAESIRRRFKIAGSDIVIGLASMGDGEAHVASRYIAPDLLRSAHHDIEALRLELEHLRHEAREEVKAARSEAEAALARAGAAEAHARLLSEATSVRLALKSASLIQSAVPFLVKPLRALMGR